MTGIATEFFLPGGDNEGLRQEARLGLLKAIQKFDTGRGVPFDRYMRLSVRMQAITAVKTATRRKHQMLSDAARDAYDSERGEMVMIVDLFEEPNGDAQTILERRDELRRLIVAFACLTPLERRSLLAVVNGDLVHEGGKNKQADNAIQRARRKLHWALNKEAA